MTYQETIWKNQIVMVTGIISRSGKLHRYLCKFVGRSGVVVGEAKNNMLLIEFSARNKDQQRIRYLRSIPSSCVTPYCDIKRAGAPRVVNDQNRWHTVPCTTETNRRRRSR